MLFTKWGEDLKKDAPLSEYPRPQFKRDSYITLNGEWDLAFCEGEEVPEKYD